MIATKEMNMPMSEEEQVVLNKNLLFSLLTQGIRKATNVLQWPMRYIAKSAKVFTEISIMVKVSGPYIP